MDGGCTWDLMWVGIVQPPVMLNVDCDSLANDVLWMEDAYGISCALVSFTIQFYLFTSPIIQKWTSSNETMKIKVSWPEPIQPTLVVVYNGLPSVPGLIDFKRRKISCMYCLWFYTCFLNPGHNSLAGHFTVRGVACCFHHNVEEFFTFFCCFFFFVSL